MPNPEWGDLRKIASDISGTKSLASSSEGGWLCFEYDKREDAEGVVSSLLSISLKTLFLLFLARHSGALREVSPETPKFSCCSDYTPRREGICP